MKKSLHHATIIRSDYPNKVRKWKYMHVEKSDPRAYGQVKGVKKKGTRGICGILAGVYKQGRSKK